MNGAECLLRTLLANDVDLCLANPGTSEMQFVAALDRVPGMRGVLCLQEAVCSGAADGYARMAGKPAATLLHLGPGLANALSNLHNARKAHSPVINIVGEHSTQHLAYNAPLTADIAAIAATMSHWVRTLESPQHMGEAAAALVQAARQPPGQIATLIIPADHSWNPAGAPGPVVPPHRPCPPDASAVRNAVRLIREGAALLLGGGTLTRHGLEAAGRLAAAGVQIFSDRYAARTTHAPDLFQPQRLPYFPERAQPLLAHLRHLILVEAQPPVSFFGYPTHRSLLAPPECECFTLAALEQDGTAALHALADALRAPAFVPTHRSAPALPPNQPLTPTTLGQAIGALLPHHAIVSDEMVSAGEPVLECLGLTGEYDHLPVCGGSIGQGLPVAVGAALACHDRKVFALEGDGSAMYTHQALWTMAREKLDVVTVIFANKRYRILDVEMGRTGAGEPGRAANDMMDLHRPELDWVKLSEGLGVPARRAATTGEFITAFLEAVTSAGPILIEAVLAD
jgi:acetolactate synthase-1/2/3 large subunit